MNNKVINAHIKFGDPCGEDAGFFDIADWAGTLLLELHQWNETSDRSAESWEKLNEILKEFQEDYESRRNECPHGLDDADCPDCAMANSASEFL